ncbi:ABC transporter substrate-binding protein [Schumannella soli]|uniref:ABC transporter substrate-binding protein n=1 Tax=Schumannella soli TaxID=2590779 RepID=A0A506XV64_9MICO|nr:ABC transporter substrate-binding protein [Schumannella soli]TPW74036.1 ABC transporter substrate-binding protein [Schumannella soli]
MKFRKIVTGISVTAVAALALVGCAPGGSGDGSASADQTLTIGALADITDWDPAQAHVGHALQPYQAPYDTLILREPDGKLSPMLATKWSYDDSLTKLTVDLRDDVTFSDGAKFDADAVVANFTHFQKENGRQAAQLVNLDKAVATDEDTVEVTLKQPDPAFTYFLSQAAGLMGSPKALDGDAIGSDPVGTGPYVMDKKASVAGSQYVFTKRKGYWNPDLQKFGGVTFKILIDVTARTNALVSGQVNATLLDARSASQADGAGFTLTKSQVDWGGLLLLDREGKLAPALGDVRVRQAINYALDRKALVKSLQVGYGTATAQPFGPASGAYDKSLDDAYPYDPAKAKKLLAEAGYADGFTLTVPGIASFEAIYAAVGQQLSEVGITLKADPVPDQEIVNKIAGGSFPAAYFQLFQGEAWVAINQIISTNALYNSFDSMTPELQELIDEVQAAPTAKEGDAAAKKINELVVDQAWFAPLYRLDQLYYTDKTVTVVAQTQMAVPSIYNYAPAGAK